MKLQSRHGELTDTVDPGAGRVRVEFKSPTRGLFGIRTEFLCETRGTGLLYHTFLEYGRDRQPLTRRAGCGGCLPCFAACRGPCVTGRTTS